MPNPPLLAPRFHVPHCTIPFSWLNRLKHNGKPDLNAAVILSKIVNECEANDSTETRIHYRSLEKDLGLSVKQIRESFKRLESWGLIKRNPKTLNVEGRPVPNVMFIEIFPESINLITF